MYEGDWQGPELKGVKENSPCFDAGHCILHSEDGRRLHAFRNKVVRVLMDLCPRKSREFQLRDTGFLVLRFRGRPFHSFFGADGGGSEEDAGCEAVYRFWHLSFMLLSPLCPVFMEWSV